MAGKNKRMFSLDIVDTDKFLEMPVSSQNLYFHLGMRADDEGFVSSPKKIATFVGCNIDDLRLLISKEYLIPFESGVVVITHWNCNNWVRADRKQPTQYPKELGLLTLENNVYTVTDTCQPNVNQMTDSCHTEIRLDKNSIDKNSIDIYTSETDEATASKIDFDGIKNYFNTYCTGFPSIREMTNTRKTAIKNFLKKHSEADLYQLFTMAQESDFLTGSTGWKAGFDWILKPANSVKILEGNYENKNTKQSSEPKGFQGLREWAESNREDIQNELEEKGLNFFG